MLKKGFNREKIKNFSLLLIHDKSSDYITAYGLVLVKKPF